MSQNKILKLLVIENIEDDVLLIANELEKPGYQILSKSVNSKKSFLESINQEDWDIIIFNYNVVNSSESLKLLEDINIVNKDIPIIIISDDISEEATSNLKKEYENRFILKNNLDKLYEFIEKVLQDSELHKENINSNKVLFENEEFSKAVLDSLDYQVAILDKDGFIIAVNSAWNQFALNNGGDLNKVGIGTNYFNICRSVTSNDKKIAEEVADGLKKIIDGSLAEFSLEYPCDSLYEKRWFLFKAVPFLKQNSKVLVTHTNITEQKLAVEFLKERERQLNQAQKIANIGSWERDSVTGKIHWSDQLFCIYGLQPQEIEINDVNFINFVYPDDREFVKNTLEQAVITKQPFHVEHRIIDNLGNLKVIDAQGEFISNIYGIIEKFVGTAQDITKRKEFENEIKKERNFISVILDTVEALIITLDTQGRIVTFNRACEITTGYSFEEVKNKNAFDFLVPPEENIDMKELFIDMTNGKGYLPLEYENQWIMKDGTKKMFSWRNSSIQNKNGDIEFIIGTGINITDKKIAENVLREQAELLDKAQDAIILRDLDYNVIYWNKSAERLYGWTAEEILHKNSIDFLYNSIDKLSDLLVEPQKMTFEKGEWTGELHQLTKSGNEIIVHSNWTLIKDDSGNPKSILTVNTDITEKKKIELQFLQSQRIESIGTLTGGIAHDLNNVLAPIMMAIGILKLNIGEKKRSEILSTLETTVKRGSDIIKQLLVFARGQTINEKSVIKIEKLIEEISAIVKETFPKSISLVTDTPDNIWNVIGDNTQLLQMLLNLSVNARDAMSDNGQLSISAENIELDENSVKININAKSGPYVHIKVADTGSGIPKEIIDKIFEPFFTTKDIGKGTGLGLSTLSGIIKSHGGFVNVNSEVGVGTEFHLYLPAIKITNTEKRSDELSENLMGNGEILLLIDDEAPILEVLKMALEAYGYNIMTANSGAEALEIFIMNKNAIKLIVTDVSMPGMDGLKTLKLFQKIQPSVKVIFTSGLPGNKKLIEESDIKNKIFVHKPYSTTFLLKEIKKILNN